MPSKIEQDYGHRLVVNIVDDVALLNPDRPFVFVPRSGTPEDGWKPVTYGEVANAIDYMAHLIYEKVKRNSEEAFPTLAYIGAADLRYAVIMLACVKAGCQAFFISPRNSLEGQLSLLERTKCNDLWYSDTHHSMVQPWVNQRPMGTFIVPDMDILVQESTKKFPYNRTFQEAEWEPLVVLHTSGSTGIPKPIVVRQGSGAIADRYRKLPELDGKEFFFKNWAETSQTVFAPFPMFHAAGMMGGIVMLVIYYGIPISLSFPDQPLSADLVIKSLTYAGVDSALLPPSILEDLSRSEDGIRELRKLNYIGYGGGSLPRHAGDRLIRNGVFPRSLISSTEVAPYAICNQPDPELWQYFVFDSDAMGALWRCKDEQEGIYELIFKKKDSEGARDQPAFYAFPELTEWSTGDLYKPHPSLPNYWMYHGRGDDIIVFTNGEKLNPVTIEETVAGHPSLKSALVVGQERFQPALILEPHKPVESDEGAKALIDEVWPLIEAANKDAVAHGRIVRRLVTVSDPNIPFLRAPKGTIQRASTIKAYKQNIDTLYENSGETNGHSSVPLDIGSEAALTRSITELIATELKLKNLDTKTDLFSLGVDSLQVISISSALQGSLKSASAQIDGDTIAPRVIYANPTPTELGAYLFSIITTNGGSNEGAKKKDEERELKKLESLIEKYTRDLPAAIPDKPEPVYDGQSVLITGTTGSLGAYILDELCAAANVKKIFALNRGGDGGESRQSSISAARGLGLDFTKVEFLGADLSVPDLGLGPAKYSELLSSVDRILHNAWPVNFNISIASFEPSIRGVRHLADLSNSAAKRVPIVFVSSVGTITNWSSQKPIPEERFDDLSLATMGYGRSKLAGSLVLDAATSRSGVPVASVRVGQIAGPRKEKGLWNPQELFPSLVASSLYLGLLPNNLGQREIIDWMPIEDVARVHLDIAGVTAPTPLSDISGYFHCNNPSQTTWTSLLPALKKFYGDRIKETVSISEWVAALETSATTSNDLSRNPGVKLLDSLKGLLGADDVQQQPPGLETKRAARLSSSITKMGPVTPELFTLWCSQWNF